MAGSVAVHRAAWLSSSPSELTIRAASVLHVLEFPGWFALRLTAGHWGRDLLWVPLLVAAASWTFWFASGAIVFTIRRLLVGARRPRPTGIDLSRRRFMVDVPLAAGAALPAGGVIHSTMISPWDLKLRRYAVPIRDLAPAFEGLRLVQLSDTHLGPRVPLGFLRRCVRDAIDLSPDVFLLTGDYIMSGQSRIAEATGLFAPLVGTRKPVVGVLGNHDWYGDGPAVSAAMREIGVTMIDNGRVFLRGDRSLAQRHEQAALCIAGVGDYVTDTVDYSAALSGVPEETPRLLLSHNPDAAEMPECTEPGCPRIDLMISGHTHGGQILLPVVGAPFIPSRYGAKYLGGLVNGPAFPVLVSRGIGMSILPVRYGVPPELVEITLVRAGR